MHTPSNELIFQMRICALEGKSVVDGGERVRASKRANNENGDDDDGYDDDDENCYQRVVNACVLL